MSADKPMRGHGLMQAIARINRVFRERPGGLVVDYLGLADQLKKALVTYTESSGKGDPNFDTAQAIAVMLEKQGIACDLMHGFNWDVGACLNGFLVFMDHLGQRGLSLSEVSRETG